MYYEAFLNYVFLSFFQKNKYINHIKSFEEQTVWDLYHKDISDISRRKKKNTWEDK